MAKLTINPADVVDYKTPLYKEDREAKKVYRLLPETTADQVALAAGGNVETKIASMNTQIAAAKTQADKGVADAAAAQTVANTAQGTANTALNNANTAINNANQAIADAVQANQTANSALATANTASSNANTALSKANQANAAAVLMTGATASNPGTQGLVPAPAAGAATRYLRSDGTWQNPPNTTYGAATESQDGLMTSADKIALINSLSKQAKYYSGGKGHADTALDGIFLIGRTEAGLTGAGFVFIIQVFYGDPAASRPRSQIAFGYGGTTGLLQRSFDGTSWTAWKEFIASADDKDTHWTSHLYAGTSNGNTNAATTNGNTHLILCDNTTVRNRVKISGSGATSVISDASGNITISSTDYNTTYSAATQSANGLMSAADKKKLDGIASGAQVNPSLSNYLTKSDNQTITGYNKILRGSGYFLNIQGDDNEIDKVPSANLYYTIPFTDKNGILAAAISLAHLTTNLQRFYITVYRNVNKSTGSLGVDINQTGNPYAFCPTPDATSNTNHVASTTWVRSRISAATGKAATSFSLFSRSRISALLLSSAKEAVSQRAQETICLGFEYEFDDQEWFFTYDLFDQENFVENMALVNAGETTVTVFPKNSEGLGEPIELTAGQFTELFKYATIQYKQAIMIQTAQRIKQIASCSSEKELEELLAEWSILNLYKDIVNGKKIVEVDPSEFLEMIKKYGIKKMVS